MKDFEGLIEICMNEVTSAGIEPGVISLWKINTRAKQRWGMCKKNASDGTFEIQIASVLLADDRVSEKACKTTIIHEILHTCKDSMKHTGNWKKYAEIMNAKYGYDIKRTTSNDEKGVEDYAPVRRLSYKYGFYCTKCGQQIWKKKVCRFTKYFRNYTCGICGTHRAFRRMK